MDMGLIAVGGALKGLGEAYKEDWKEKADMAKSITEMMFKRETTLENTRLENQGKMDVAKESTLRSHERVLAENQRVLDKIASAESIADMNSKVRGQAQETAKLRADLAAQDRQRSLDIRETALTAKETEALARSDAAATRQQIEINKTIADASGKQAAAIENSLPFKLAQGKAQSGVPLNEDDQAILKRHSQTVDRGNAALDSIISLSKSGYAQEQTGGLGGGQKPQEKKENTLSPNAANVASKFGVNPAAGTLERLGIKPITDYVTVR